MIREIVTIDEELCDGCGMCVPSCQEGALRIVDGKARLVADKYCDGMGACLGHCPRGAIKIEQRDADGFDEAAVEQHLSQGAPSAKQEACGCPSARFEAFKPSVPGTASPHQHPPAGGCPGSRFAQFRDKSDRLETGPTAQSELTHWPVQLRLLSPEAPVLTGAKLLVAADCVPVAYAGFHRDFLRDHAVVIACPKLDDPRGYVEKLEAMIRGNDLQEITVVHMEVPCCHGILKMVFEACQNAAAHVPINDVVIGIRGEILSRRRIGIGSESRP